MSKKGFRAVQGGSRFPVSGAMPSSPPDELNRHRTDFKIVDAGVCCFALVLTDCEMPTMTCINTVGRS
jgi:hypothetical protein